MPSWPEFALKHLWVHAKDNAQFFEYMPTGWSMGEGGRTPEKKFVWSIICKLETNWITENIKMIHNARTLYKQSRWIKKEPTIEITEEMVELLMGTPFIACKQLPFVLDLLVTDLNFMSFS